MAIVRPIETAKLFVGVLAADLSALTAAVPVLTDAFGPLCLEMPPLPFTGTNYYEAELGPHPFRAFFAFEGAFNPENIAECKVRSNTLEIMLAQRLSLPYPRPINIDPGYLTPAKVVLASAKNFSHRIYLAKGIYAEVTLQYVHGKIVTLPWTFPDYASGAYNDFFLGLREMLMRECPPGADGRIDKSRSPETK